MSLVFLILSVSICFAEQIALDCTHGEFWTKEAIDGRHTKSWGDLVVVIDTGSKTIDWLLHGMTKIVSISSSFYSFVNDPTYPVKGVEM